MASFNNADADGITKVQWDILLDGQFVGFTVEGNTNLTIGKTVVNVDDIEQVAGTLKTFSQLGPITLAATIAGADFDLLNNFALKGLAFQKNQAGKQPKYTLSGREINQRDPANSFSLRLHPSDAGDAVFDEDWFFGIAAIPSEVVIPARRDAKQELPLTVTIYPDFDVDIDERWGSFGDFTVVEADPDFVWITTSKSANAPYLHVPALTLDAGGVADVSAFSVVKTATASTAALNEIGDITASTVSFDYDTAVPNNPFAVGNTIEIDSELMLIETVVAATDTTGTLTVARAAFGSIAILHLDNATITKQTVAFKNITQQQAVWASSSASNVAVGNVFEGALNTRKGRLENIATGSANITAAVGATTSKILVATAN